MPNTENRGNREEILSTSQKKKISNHKWRKKSWNNFYEMKKR